MATNRIETLDPALIRPGRSYIHAVTLYVVHASSVLYVLLRRTY